MYNVMSMDTFDRSMEMIDKLDAVLENVQFRIELATLTEATDDGKTDKVKLREKSKLVNFAANTAETIWGEILKVIQNLADQVIYIIRTRSGRDAVLKKDLTVSAYCDEPVPISRMESWIKTIETAAEPDIPMARDNIDYLRRKTKNHKAGETINIKGIYNTLVTLKKEAKNLQKKEKELSKKDDASSVVMKEIRGFYKDIISGIRSLIINTDSIAKAERKAKKAENNANNESAIPYGMSRNEYIASIMLEAADLLKDDVVKDSSEVKEFSDIPEETPVKQDEYETSVVGGDDEKPDLEEIKDLCDNDPEVVKLLTDDEDKSVTVDSDGETNTESAFDFFNLDF